MKDYYYEIGRRIASLRKEHHITQEKFAEILEISIKHCSEVERGLSSLSLEKLIYVADYFDCSLDYLIHGTDSGSIEGLLPKNITLILQSDDSKEIELLSDYLHMYSKLRNLPQP